MEVQGGPCAAARQPASERNAILPYLVALASFKRVLGANARHVTYELAPQTTDGH